MPWKIIGGAAAALLLTLVLITGACVGMYRQNSGIAEEFINRFHDQMNAGDFDAIYATTSELLRQETPRPEFDKALAELRETNGELGDFEITRFNSRVDGNRWRLTVLTRTQVPNGLVAERFELVGEGKTLVLQFYRANPIAADSAKKD